MKTHLMLCVALLAAVMAVAGQAEAAGADAIVGVWQTESGGYVQIYDAGSSYAGRVVGSVSGQPRYDENNPDPDKRGRRLLGVTVFRGLQYEGDDSWGDGEVYDPTSGKTYALKAWLRGPDKLEVRGYVGLSLFGRSQTWTPVAPDAPHLDKSLLDGSRGVQAGD